jgi:hypothetical protein
MEVMMKFLFKPTFNRVDVVTVAFACTYLAKGGSTLIGVGVALVIVGISTYYENRLKQKVDKGEG